MKRFKAIVAYDGTRYHGWQLQANATTIQGELEKALYTILRVFTRVHGAGRTDSGVHAVGQTAHFDAVWKTKPQALLRALNAVLPRDIAVSRLEIADSRFHCQLSAKAKTYEYAIYNDEVRAPLSRLYAIHVNRPLDVSAMNEAACVLVGTHDFASYGSPPERGGSTVRRVHSADFVYENGLLRFRITGSGFLRYMVRCIVGTLLRVGLGKISPDGFRRILEARDRDASGPTAPPEGLCLMSVAYENALSVHPEGAELPRIR